MLLLNLVTFNININIFINNSDIFVNRNNIPLCKLSFAKDGLVVSIYIYFFFNILLVAVADVKSGTLRILKEVAKYNWLRLNTYRECCLYVQDMPAPLHHLPKPLLPSPVDDGILSYVPPPSYDSR